MRADDDWLMTRRGEIMHNLELTTVRAEKRELLKRAIKLKPKQVQKLHPLQAFVYYQTLLWILPPNQTPSKEKARNDLIDTLYQTFYAKWGPMILDNELPESER